MKTLTMSDEAYRTLRWILRDTKLLHAAYCGMPNDAQGAQLGPVSQHPRECTCSKSELEQLFK